MQEKTKPQGRGKRVPVRRRIHAITTSSVSQIRRSCSQVTTSLAITRRTLDYCSNEQVICHPGHHMPWATDGNLPMRGKGYPTRPFFFSCESKAPQISVRKTMCAVLVVDIRDLGMPTYTGNRRFPRTSSVLLDRLSSCWSAMVSTR